MKISEIRLKDFKRFKDLTISGLTESVKLIVLVGPNGCGKSSLFDAIYGNVNQKIGRYNPSSGTYYDRIPTRSDYHAAFSGVNVSFYGGDPLNHTAWEKAVYVRSAYRNTPSFSFNQLQQSGSALKERRISRMIDNDQATMENYNRLVSQAFEEAFETKEGNKTLDQFREEIIADIRDSVHKLFPELTLNSLGNPLGGKATFRFKKGNVDQFTYENLSGGEKSAFDLILDLIIKRQEYDDTVFCIDEPESHMNIRIQRELLAVLYSLIPDNSQLWIATHSIGMMRGAQDLQKKNPNEVVFLDFSKRDFDIPQKIQPVQMNRAQWEHMHSVALDDLANLIFPDVLYVCESTHEKSFDADCYNTIFSSKYPNVSFASVGSKADVKNWASIMQKATPNLNIIPLRDRDNMTEEEIKEEKRNNVRVLSRLCIESYLLDDEVLTVFCNKQGLPSETVKKLQEIRDVNQKSLKKAAQDIRTSILKINQSLKIGDNWEAFLKHSLAPLIHPDMQVYKDLEHDIFDDQNG